jgi:methionyl-tRNA formyltransferase
MRMEAGLDSGPILLARETPIGPAETGGELTTRLARLGAEALREAIERLRTGAAEFVPQDHTTATITPKIDHAVARIDWARPAGEVVDRIRAFDPTPGAWSTLDGQEIKCFRARVVAEEGPPGTVQASRAGLLVAAAGAAVEIGEVKPAGRGRMKATEWLRGHPLEPGSRFR